MNIDFFTLSLHGHAHQIFISCDTDCEHCDWQSYMEVYWFNTWNEYWIWYLGRFEWCYCQHALIFLVTQVTNRKKMWVKAVVLDLPTFSSFFSPDSVLSPLTGGGEILVSTSIGYFMLCSQIWNAETRNSILYNVGMPVVYSLLLTFDYRED